MLNISPRKLVNLLLGAALALAANMASAKTEAISFSLDGDAYIGNTFAANTGSFTDYFTFSIPSLNTGDVVGTAIAGFKSIVKVGLVQTVSFTGFDLYSGSAGSGSMIAAGDVSFPAIGSVYANALSAGNYYLQVSGKVASVGGSYGGNLSLITTPVPEPGSYAMFLAGLGLMGVIARRRKI